MTDDQRSVLRGQLSKLNDEYCLNEYEVAVVGIDEKITENLIQSRNFIKYSYFYILKILKLFIEIFIKYFLKVPYLYYKITMKIIIKSKPVIIFF